MSEATARFALPFILPGQAQKELFHNEALARIDMALSPAVEGAPLASPPADAAEGRIWIVSDAGTGEWAGENHHLATLTSGGWRFLAPHPGMLVWDKAAQLWSHFTGSGWSGGAMPASSIVIGGQKVVGERQPEVPSPSGGTIIDVEARAAIAGLTAALKSHGLIA